MEEAASVSSLKRHREEENIETNAEEETKRQKPSSSSSSSSYDQVLRLLEDSEEQDELDRDVTSLINTLQQEITSDEQNTVGGELVKAGDVEDIDSLTLSSCSSSSSLFSCVSKEDDDEDDKERVMRHLLEASDDELGIPSTEFGGSNYEITNNNDSNQDYVNGRSFLDGFGDALWEFEDEAANYYTLLQSELFM